MNALLATLWIGLWFCGVALAVIYNNFDLEFTALITSAGFKLGSTDQTMECIMLHTVLCMPMIARSLERALHRPPPKTHQYSLKAEFLVVVINLFVIALALFFLTKPLFAYAGRDALALFVDATTYAGFLSATVLLLVSTLVDANKSPPVLQAEEVSRDGEN